MKNVQIVYAFVLLFAAIVAATKVVQIKLGCMISLFTKKVVIFFTIFVSMIIFDYICAQNA
jgi:hypothetical protein